jgi:nitrogen-specific signal transduction histidine kinase
MPVRTTTNGARRYTSDNLAEIAHPNCGVAPEVISLASTPCSLRARAALLPLEREKTDRYLLTERARSDDEVAHRDDFMGIVSHDLRNLLGGIAGNARLLSKQAPESDEGRRTVAVMERIQRYVAIRSTATLPCTSRRCSGSSTQQTSWSNALSAR